MNWKIFAWRISGKKKLSQQGWSEQAISRFLNNWAVTTRHAYNIAVNKFKVFCEEADTEFYEFSSATLADYLCWLASTSRRPRSVLNMALAAISQLTEAMGRPDPVNADISKLVTGLIKCETSAPMVRSKVMPVQPFLQLFESWPGNWCLKIEQLRLKTITLLAIAYYAQTFRYCTMIGDCLRGWYL